MNQQRIRQTWAIARSELRRLFFSRRSLWVYLLALFPSVVFFVYGLNVKLREQRWSRAGTVSPAVMATIQEGDRVEDVLRRAGSPVERFAYHRGPRDEYINEFMRYFDGHDRYDLNFSEGRLQHKQTRPLAEFDEDRTVYAAVFQFFYLRLGIFFGCLGIFMNLFRGEMLDKTLHFWFLIPARREILLAGKYLAGLIATTLIFGGGAMLCFGIMLWPHDPAEIQRYWQVAGWSHMIRYGGAAMLACLGYGSVFLAAGLLIRNPIIPAVILLLWESINGFLPSMLQKLSVLYYVQSLCPVAVPIDPDTPTLVRLFLSPAEPPGAVLAVLGLLGVTALVLWAASHAVRRLEINYGTE